MHRPFRDPPQPPGGDQDPGHDEDPCWPLRHHDHGRPWGGGGQGGGPWGGR